MRRAVPLAIGVTVGDAEGAAVAVVDAGGCGAAAGVQPIANAHIAAKMFRRDNATNTPRGYRPAS